MRSKHQFTLPARIARQANIQTDDQLTVTYANGHIILSPIQSRIAKDDVMSYSGIFSGAWGGTAAQVDQTLHHLHNEWES
jgi:bifunctional DNA-binding transcriptional regulator/antitoxin component of YhaV-PrlF toxin-antitoxin module